MTAKRKRKDGEFEFRILLAATMPLFLAVTFARRAMPWNWGRDKRSAYAAARCDAYNAIPFAFM